MEILIEHLTNPPTLYSRDQVLSTPGLVPRVRGLYSWFFRFIPTGVPTHGCMTKDGMTLLYVGISPKNEMSSQNLRTRITTHFRGNAEGSTLRLTLGTLLMDQSGFPLRRVGSGKRMTFTHQGERWLDEWMTENAFVHWVEHPIPWSVEGSVIQNLSLPLNIRDNDHHPFARRLSEMRSIAKQVARELPVECEDGQRRRL